MTDELPEWPADTPAQDEEQVDTETGLMDRLAEMLHRAFNDRPSDLGPQVLTKWLVVAEVANGDGRTLRWVDSDIPSWDIKGMLQEVMDDVKEQRLLYSIACMVNDEDEEGV